MWKTLLVCAFAVSCIPADPGPTYYPPQQQWGQPQPPPPQQPPVVVVQPPPNPNPPPNPYPPPNPNPPPNPPPPPQDNWTFDSRGWTLLGTATVYGRNDHDVIAVGKYQGRFDELTMVVYDNDLQLDSMVVTFGNNETFAPSIKHYFKESSRSAAIDLPGDDRHIKTIDLAYSSLGRGVQARV